MANWAQTSYRIEGNSKDLQELIDLCKAFLDKKRPVMDKGASVEWEGNIILALGIELDTSYIRGFIQSYELVDGILYIEAEEAWGATDFRHLLEGHCRSVAVRNVNSGAGPCRICSCIRLGVLSAYGQTESKT